MRQALFSALVPPSLSRITWTNSHPTRIVPPTHRNAMGQSRYWAVAAGAVIG